MESERKLKVEQLQRAVSDKDEERNLIREQANEVELELRKVLEENTQLRNQHSAQSDQQSVSPHRRLNSDHCAPF